MAAARTPVQALALAVTLVILGLVSVAHGVPRRPNKFAPLRRFPARFVQTQIKAEARAAAQLQEAARAAGLAGAGTKAKEGGDTWWTDSLPWW
jgi:hypothetical protein